MRRRYDRALERAGLRCLRFHDLRQTFGTRMIARADIRRVQEWMGHADIQTTMRYLHYAPPHDDAALAADAFRRETVSTVLGAILEHAQRRELIAASRIDGVERCPSWRT